MWAIRKEENDFYAVKNNVRMRFSRSKTECPPLQRLNIPSKEDLRSKRLNCDAQRAVIMTFLGGRRQFASRADFDWGYNDLCRQFKMFTEVEEFVEAVNIAIGNFDIVQETPIDSQATVYHDDSGFLEPVCPETCDPEADGSESHSFEPPLKKQKVKPLQASLSKSQALTNDKDDILKSIRGKTLSGIHKIFLSRIETPGNPYRDTNSNFVKQVQNGQTLACTTPQPLALHLIGESSVVDVDIEHLNGYSYVCLGGNHQRLAAMENHALYPHMAQFVSLPSHIFVNLTAEEELFVSTNHNMIGHNINRLTHKDMVKVFRSLKPAEICVETSRCENTKAWRAKCQQHLPPGSDISSYQSLLWIASASEDVYKRILLVYDLYEEGKLKNQKLKKQDSIQTPKLNVTRPWRALMTLPEETVLELVTKVTNLKCDLEEMTKDAEYLKTTRNIQYAVCKLAKLNWQTCLEKFWDNEEEAEEELSQFIGDVRRGVPGERLRKYIESKLQDPSQRALPTVLQEDPVSFLKSGKTMELCPDTVVFNEEVSEWQQLLRAVMDLPTLQEEHCIIISTSWETVSDIKKSVELMFPSKAVAVIVHHNKKGNYTQPFVALATRNRRALPVLIEGNTRDTLFEKLFTNAQGSLLVMHCGKGEALKAGLKRGLQVMGIDPRKEMIRSCSRFLQ